MNRKLQFQVDLHYQHKFSLTKNNFVEELMSVDNCFVGINNFEQSKKFAKAFQRSLMKDINAFFYSLSSYT